MSLEKVACTSKTKDHEDHAKARHFRKRSKNEKRKKGALGDPR